MQITEYDELLIQRCVDNELTSEELQTLLARLESLPDGWRALACGFLEDRAIGRCVRSESVLSQKTSSNSAVVRAEYSSNQRTSAGEVVPSASVDSAWTVRSESSIGTMRARRHSVWAHPLTSLSLCAAIAFVAGMLIPDRHPREAEHPLATTASPDARSSEASSAEGLTPAAKRGGLIPAPGVRPGQSYQVEFQPDGSSGPMALQIPVVRNPEELSQAFLRDTQIYDSLLEAHPGISSQLRHGQLQMYRVPANEKEDLILFVNERRLGPPIQ